MEAALAVMVAMVSVVSVAAAARAVWEAEDSAVTVALGKHHRTP